MNNKTLAEVIHMAPNSFSRLFRENMGITPHQFLQKRKVAYACELFEHSIKQLKKWLFFWGFQIVIILQEYSLL
jgi:AraC-like DNA-binding protein